MLLRFWLVVTVVFGLGVGAGCGSEDAAGGMSEECEAGIRGLLVRVTCPPKTGPNVRGDPAPLASEVRRPDISEAKRLKELEDENRRLKSIVADLTLDNSALKGLLSKKW